MAQSKDSNELTIKKWRLKVLDYCSYSDLKLFLSYNKTLYFIALTFILILLWNTVCFYVFKEIYEYNSDCLCNGENFCFSGINENGTQVNGRKFPCSLYDDLKSNNLLDSDAIKTKNDYNKLDDTWQPVFVTFTTRRRFVEVKKLITTVHKYYPNSKIVIFDFEMRRPENIKQIKGWCNVEYKMFDYNAYSIPRPNLRNYATKMIIIEALKIYKTFFYLDPSVQISNQNLIYFLQGVQQKYLLPFSTYSTHANDQHGVHSTIHENMSNYLPLPSIISQINQVQTSFIFVSDSSYTRYVLKWYYLCASTKNCVYPRFDQNYWNIATQACLFGEKRGALELGYVKKDWTQLDENLVAQVNQSKDRVLNLFSSIVNPKRRERVNIRSIRQCRNNIYQ